MDEITIDVWLYGPLAEYGGEANAGSFANLPVTLPTGSTVADLLARLGLPTAEPRDHLCQRPTERHAGPAARSGAPFAGQRPRSVFPPREHVALPVS